jgi:hypothetical protein
MIAEVLPKLLSDVFIFIKGNNIKLAIIEKYVFLESKTKAKQENKKT